jgi:methyltransferase (TIGR00027 family)
MEENQVSQLSLTTAYCRAYHASHDNPKIFNDFLAPFLFTEEEHKLRIQKIMQGIKALQPERASSFPDQETALAWFMQNISAAPITLSRSRYTEDILEQAIKRGVQQYVILGAGMDTFAYRRTDIVNQLQVFEIDHPATQAYKCRRIAALGWETPSNLHFIPVDFTNGDLKSALSACSSYNPKALTFFSWLGVTYYLPQDAVFATLRTIAKIAPHGSSIVFDYFSTDAKKDISVKAQLGQQISIQVGEPLKSFFDPSTLASDMSQLGLLLAEHLSPPEIESRYFQGRADNYHATQNTHLAKVVVE